MKKRFVCIVVAILMFVCFSALAEDSSIPVISLDGDCLVDYTNWNDKSTYYPATLTYADGEDTFTMDIEIRPQGTTSLYAPKKNFTIQFAEGVEFADSWGVQKKYVLKADYVDPTRSCNVVSAKLAAEMNEKYGVMVDTPNFGVIDGFPVWVKINGENAGIFNMTIPKDAWLFNMDASNPNHMVLACEGWSAASRMQSAEIDYEADWTFEVGEPTDENKAAFERMVEFVSTADDKTFVENFDQYLDLDACLNYICFVNTAYAGDNVAKNMLMVTYDGKTWAPALYDLDSLWGVGYDGTLQSDAIWQEGLLTNGNCLLYRVNFLFGDQVRERYWELREGILSKEHIMESFEAYAAQIPQEYYDIDHALWNEDDARVRTFELMSQLMDEYLPMVDAHFVASDEAELTVEASAVTGYGPTVHYVWEKDGVQQSSGDIAALPVSTTISYMLDGNAISAQELAGKSGQLLATLRVERKPEAAEVYGVAALVHVEEEQCANVNVTGGAHATVAQEDVYMGSAWLGGTNNVYEMQLSMDVTEFDPAEYMAIVTPVHITGGGDNSAINALLTVGSELTGIINEGILLHESMVEWHGFLTNIQNNLTTTSAAMQGLVPAEEEPDSARSVMQKLLADAETDADVLLMELGYEGSAEATADDRVQMLSEAAADAVHTEEEKAQAAELLNRMESYRVVVAELEEKQQVMSEINKVLTGVAANLPDLTGAYAYANDQVYAILYKIFTLYQNLENYYHAYAGSGNAYDFLAWGDGYDVIVFTNDEGIMVP